MERWLSGVIACGLVCTIGVGELHAEPSEGPVAQASSDDQAEASSKTPSDEDKAKRVLKLLKEGKQAAKAENYQKAYDLFEEANSLYPRPGLQFRLGQLAERNGDKQKALSHFMKYLEVTPPIDEADEDTKEDIEYAETRIDELRESMTAKLEVGSTPGGASVYLESTDGEPIGRTPVTHELDREGEVRVILEKSGYKQASKKVRVQRGESSSITLELTAESSSAQASAEEAMKEPQGPASSSSTGAKRGAGAFPAIGWGAAGLGVVGIGTGVALHAMYQQTDNEIDTYSPTSPGNSEAELADLEDQAEVELNGAVAGYSAGGAFFVTGATILVYHYLIRDGGGDDAQAGVHPTLRVGASGAVGGFSVRF